MPLGEMRLTCAISAAASTLPTGFRMSMSPQSPLRRLTVGHEAELILARQSLQQQRIVSRATSILVWLPTRPHIEPEASSTRKTRPVCRLGGGPAAG